MAHDPDIEAIEKGMAEITEYYDVVQILASRVNEDGQTERVFLGQGNAYARYAMTMMALDYLDAEFSRPSNDEEKYSEGEE